MPADSCCKVVTLYSQQLVQAIANGYDLYRIQRQFVGIPSQVYIIQLGIAREVVYITAAAFQVKVGRIGNGV